jgi:hypothetical protein
VNGEAKGFYSRTGFGFVALHLTLQIFVFFFTSSIYSDSSWFESISKKPFSLMAAIYDPKV